MDAHALYTRILQLKAAKKQFILVLTKDTIQELVRAEIPEANADDINVADMWFAGIHVYLGRMNKIVFTAGELWLD